MKKKIAEDITNKELKETLEFLRSEPIKTETEIPNDNTKEVIEYDIPINNKEDCERINKSLGTNFRPTEEHINELIEKLCNAIEKVGDAGGWYIGDGIKVKIELEYDPENK